MLKTLSWPLLALLAALTISFLFGLTGSALAHGGAERPERPARPDLHEHLDLLKARICERLEARGLSHLPPLCEAVAEPEPEPEPEPPDADGDGVPDETDNCPAVANPGQEDSDGDGEGDVCDETPDGDPEPEPTDTDGDGVPDEEDNCPNDENSSQEDADGDGEGDVCDDTPNGDPEPEPTVDHILITEVLYDLAQDGSQGSESGGDNEWVELYNPTAAPVDLMDWEIGDGISNDVISDSSLVLAAGEYLVITDATTTADFWDFTGVDVLFLESSISGGLSNNGDSVILYDASSAMVDGVSYGDSDTAFAPSVADVGPGSSIERSSLDNDSDSATDWQENTTPSPGS